MPASKKEILPKPCRFCKKEFLTNNVRRLYCSANCNTFYQRSLNPDKHRAYAADIMRKRSIERKKKDAIRKRDLRLQREYNISQSVYDSMSVIQDGKCAICRKANKLVVDHNHVTGKVRGLLCHYCNRGLGFFSDDDVFLENAIKYLQKDKLK